jgi:predicted anti-sigma-YlaC factor YlaD
MEIIPCKQATFLMSKREEHALTLVETVQLYIHLLVCEFCRRFLKQTKLITKASKRVTSNEYLTSEEKQKMKDSLNLA